VQDFHRVEDRVKDLTNLRDFCEIQSEESLARLIEMSDQLEKANVRRLKYAVELATLRKVPVKEIIQKLGIPLGADWPGHY
jgi:hypothetical protein